MSDCDPAEVVPCYLVEVGELPVSRPPLGVQIDLLLPHDQPPPGPEPLVDEQRGPALTGRLGDLAPEETLLRSLQDVSSADESLPGGVGVTPPHVPVLELCH